MARPAPADPARARLLTLGSAPPRPPDPGWGGPSQVEVGVPAAPAERIGWPTAAPGTPAARLRLPVPDLPPREPGPGGPSGEHGRGGAWPSRDDDRDRAHSRGAPTSWEDGDERHDSHDRDDDPWATPPRSRAWAAAGERRVGRWAERWLPASWVEARWDPGRAGAVALALVAAVAAVVAAVGVWSGRPVAEPVPALPVVAGAPSSLAGLPSVGGAPAAPAPVPLPVGGKIVVSVTGKVAKPGMVRLAPGSRVGDAVEAAGGARPEADLTGLNLAQRVNDGEQVVVGVPTPAAPAPAGTGGAATGAGGAPGAASSGAAAPGGKVDLNAATLEQLDGLPGVGPVTAQKIVDWRTQNGRFGAVEQLQEISGIGEARFATLKELVSV